MAVTMHVAGRVLLLRCLGAVDGAAPSVLAVSEKAKARNAKLILVDTTQADYADTAGLRWLLALHNAIDEGGRHLRVVACHGARIWRTLAMLGPMTSKIELFDDISAAWRIRGKRPENPTGVNDIAA